MPGKSSGNLTALTTYESAKTPRTHGDLFHPEFFEPANLLIVFTNLSIEVVVLGPVLAPDQQIFGIEPVLDGIP